MFHIVPGIKEIEIVHTDTSVLGRGQEFCFVKPKAQSFKVLVEAQNPKFKPFWDKLKVLVGL